MATPAPAARRRHPAELLACAVALSVLALGTGGPAYATPTPPAPVATPAVSAAPAAGARTQPSAVTERAAQRDEELARTAEDTARVAQAESLNARDLQLSAADRDRIAAALQLATDNARLATQQRAAAASQTPPGSGAVPAPAPETPPPAPAGVGAQPVPNAVIGAGFGEYGHWSRYHTGIDFRAAYGTPVVAVQAGTVVFAGNSGDWAGNHVAIAHGDGVTTMSSHFSAIAVSAGQPVAAGQLIGYVGQSGRAFGAHLHFEVYPPGVRYGDVYRAVDPRPWLVANGVTLH